MEASLITCIRKHLGRLGHFDGDAELVDLGYDSFKFIELVLILEREFKMEFADDDLRFRKFKRVADLAVYVEMRANTAERSSA